MNIKNRQSCRICGNLHLTPVIDLGEQYFQGSFIKDGVQNPPTRKTPNLVVRCDTSLFQDACGLIQTKHTIPPRILYTNYWYQSGISQTMRNHLKSIVDEARKITGLDYYKGNVLDIASNDNTLLRNYPKSYKKFGIDPSDIASKQTDNDITVINDLFPTIQLEKYSLGKQFFDIITSIACYYDVEDPSYFAEKVKEILNPKGIWIFEVAYWPLMLKNLSYDSIVNEHIIHYHLAPLEIMLNKLGLKIFNAKKTDTNGGSIMCYVTYSENFNYDCEQFTKNLSNIRLEEFNSALDDERTYEEFREEVNGQKEDLIHLLNSIKAEGKTVHIYGASTKLNTILGYCNIGPELVPYAAERSPEKFGARTISGIKLISEEESRAMKPDFYLVGPYHFKKEILEREKQSIADGIKFIFPLPKVEII
jgi:hypothetical protein